MKKKVKASLHLTFTLIPKGGSKVSAHGEKGSEKKKREPLPSPYLHRKSFVFKTIRHMNIKRGEMNKNTFTVFY